MQYIRETTISKSNNFLKYFVKNFLSMNFVFWQKDYSPLKQNKQIGSLIWDCTQKLRIVNDLFSKVFNLIIFCYICYCIYGNICVKKMFKWLVFSMSQSCLISIT